MTKLEEIARAIYADRNGSGCKPWGNLPHSHKAPYLRDALAAVKAMREPTEAMGMAGNDALDANGCCPVDESDAPTCWQAMIDAIIAEAEQEGK